MRIAVTGGNGFFGAAITGRLRQAGHDVVSASRRAEPPARVDITDLASCRALMTAYPDLDAVVHAAALAHVPAGPDMSAACEAVNVEGTRHMARAAAEAGVRRFVFISSVMVYGDYDLPVPVTEEAPLRSTSIYGSAKIRAEKIVAGFPQFDTWVLRMSTMYAPDWLLNVRKRVSAPLPGNWVNFTLAPDSPRYTLCSRRNGATVVLWAVEGRLPPGTYNVSERHVYSQREILKAVEHVDGMKLRVHVPVALPRAAAALAQFLPSARMRDNARSRYWKFCEHNVYSSDKLAGQGLVLEPDLLRVGS